MPASTLRVRKSTAAAVAAVAGLAVVGTFAIDSTGAANAATTTSATTATAAAHTATDSLAPFQRVSTDAVTVADTAADTAVRPADAATMARLTDTPASEARAAAAAKQAAAVKAAAARKAAQAKQAEQAKQAADARKAAAAKKAAAQKAAAQKQSAAQSAPSAPSGSPQQIAAEIVPAGQLASFDQIISHESGWNVEAVNPSSGSYGLGQALPADKMASAGSDWRTDAATQIKWALGYMDSRYGSPNQAWSFWQANSWY